LLNKKSAATKVCIIGKEFKRRETPEKNIRKENTETRGVTKKAVFVKRQLFI